MPTEKQLANLKAPWKRGDVPNPAGIQSGVPRVLRRLAADELAEAGTLILESNYAQLKRIVEDAKNNPDSEHSVLKVWFVAVVLRGIARGDAHALDILLNRIVGRVKETLQVDNKFDFRGLPDDELQRRRNALLDRMRERQILEQQNSSGAPIP